MKRFIIIIFLLVSNFAYYGQLASSWETLSVEGGTGRTFLGVFITILSFITINNLSEKL